MVWGNLLGTPWLRIEGTVHAPEPSLRSVLAYYVAWRGEWVPREDVANLFWGEHGTSDALRNLRQLLHTLRQTPLVDAIEIQQRRLRFLGSTDVAEFQDALMAREWERALQAWHGSFLEGFDHDHGTGVREWLDATRAELDQAHLTSLAERGAALERAGDVERAAELWGRVWRQDACDEAAFLRQIHLLQRAGRANVAAAEANAYRRALEVGLEIEPSSAVEALIAEVVAGRAIPVEVPPIEVDLDPRRTMPAATTPFVGREDEMRRLTTLLQRPDVRLVTVVGIGGAGKTRLVLEAGRRLVAEGVDVRWCPLVAVADPEDVVPAIAQAFGLSGSRVDILDELARAIGPAEMLLVVDNAEHVVGTVRDAVVRLLTACPGLQVLVASRVELATLSEWVFVLEGLRMGDGERGSDAERFFVACAQRRDPSFDRSRHAAAIESICTEVSGMPLALELLASWAGVLTPEEMLEELQEGIDTVSSSSADVPARQRSLAAVFEATWERLSDEARSALEALAPCRGGFDLAAARALGVGTRELHELVAAALVRRDGDRFGRHPLVWRYARARAREASDAWSDLQARHARHYLDRLLEQRRALSAHADVAAARALWMHDAPNLRAALVWGVEHDSDRFPDALFLFERLAFWFGAGVDPSFLHALHDRARPPLDAHLRLAAWEHATDPVVTKIPLLPTEAGANPDPVLELKALWLHARSARRSGATEDALELAGRARALIRSGRGSWGPRGAQVAARALVEASRSHRLHGQHEPARRRLLEAIALLRAVEVGSALESLELVSVDVAWGDYRIASDLAERVVERMHDDAPAKLRVRALVHQARIALARGDLGGAHARLGRAREAAQPLMPGAGVRPLRELEGVAVELALLEGDRDALRAATAHDDGGARRLLLRAWACWQRGAHEDATRWSDAAVAAAAPPWSDPDDLEIWVRGRALRSHARLALGDLLTGVPCAHDAVTAAARMGSPRWILHAATAIAHVHAAQGRSAMARAIAGRVLADERTDTATQRIAARWSPDGPSETSSSNEDLRPWAAELSRSLT